MKKLTGLSAAAILVLAGCVGGGTAEEVTMKGSADFDGGTATVQYVIVDKDITSISFDETSADYDSKKEFSDSGEYGMEAETGKSWTQHVTEVEEYVVENDAMPELQDANEEGKQYPVDGTASATIHLENFAAAFDAAEAE